MAHTKLKNDTELIKTLIRLKIPHTIYKTNKTKYISFKDEKYVVSESFMTYKELNFIRDVKKECIKNGILMHGNELACVSDVSYFEFSNKFDSVNLENEFIEIDLNTAYWITALKLNYICEDTYKKGLTYSKKCRLVCLGCLATRKVCIEFDGEKYKINDEKLIYNEITSSYFRHISFEVGSIMLSCFNRFDGLFFWVDALFIQKSKAEKVKEWIYSKGYDCKEINISSIELVELQGSDEIIISNGNEKKTFSKPRKLDKSKERRVVKSFEW